MDNIGLLKIELEDSEGKHYFTYRLYKYDKIVSTVIQKKLEKIYRMCYVHSWEFIPILD